MTDRRLYIYSEVKPDLAPLKAAKAALGLDIMVYPRAADESTGGRMIAVGSRPPWVCDYFLVDPNSSAADWEAALSWALGDHEDFEATTVIDILTSIFGPGVREISPEEYASELRMQDYLSGRV